MIEASSVDVVIPVHGNHRAVRRCLESVLAFRTPALATVAVVDDGSPDHQTVSYLDSLRERGAIDLIRHERNLGFAAAVNSGISASGRDVVLLNSDTEVHGNWVDRLLRCAYAGTDIGTVTPFSNDATICSYPFIAWRRTLPRGMSLAQLDALFARVNAAQMADLPTGIGFCLLIRRACLDAVGPFEVERFGRGYGEETDFCQRARLAGWRNVVCADTFVYHEGGGSFGAERGRRAQAAEQVLAALYPDYGTRVREFIGNDILRPFRRRVDAARRSLSWRQGIAVIEERTAETASLRALAVQARWLRPPRRP